MESIRSSTQTMMTTCSNIVETFVYIPYVEASETMIDLLVKKMLEKPRNKRLIYWWKRLFFTFFCGFRKVRFQRYRPQFKWNQPVLQLKH